MVCCCLRGIIGEVISHHIVESWSLELTLYACLPVLMWISCATLQRIWVLLFFSLFLILLVMIHPMPPNHHMAPVYVFWVISVVGGCEVVSILDNDPPASPHAHPNNHGEAAPPPMSPEELGLLLSHILVETKDPDQECCVCLEMSPHCLRNCRHGICLPCASKYSMIISCEDGLVEYRERHGMPCPICRSPHYSYPGGVVCV